jgi:hypothetical protein
MLFRQSTGLFCSRTSINNSSQDCIFNNDCLTNSPKLPIHVSNNLFCRRFAVSASVGKHGVGSDRYHAPWQVLRKFYSCKMLCCSHYAMINTTIHTTSWMQRIPQP